MLLQIAPTFIRFGSFQTCYGMDKDKGRQGPSAGMGVGSASCLVPTPLLSLGCA